MDTVIVNVNGIVQGVRNSCEKYRVNHFIRNANKYLNSSTVTTGEVTFLTFEMEVRANSVVPSEMQSEIHLCVHVSVHACV